MRNLFIYLVFTFVCFFAYANSNENKPVYSSINGVVVSIPKNNSDDFIFPKYQYIEIVGDCSASCGNKRCSGSGNCVCSCGWFKCNCSSNPSFADSKIYLTKEDYLVHKEFAEMLHNSNEASGVEASEIIANWVSDVFDTKGKKAEEFETVFFQVMASASDELKEKVNVFFEKFNVADRV